ncbi:MAG: acyl carrier protein [Lachnospiraceae bacterium]|nr:acyl carrier protein [Lachnospiraceae bacterium]
MFETIRDFLAAELNIDASTITPDTDLSRDLGADSLDLYEMIMAMEEKYDITIPEEELKSIHTINDVMEILSANGVEE